MSRVRRPRQRVGFTIVELLTVVVIVGVMSAIVVPRLRISGMTEVQLAGMQLAQDIDLSRTRALSARERVRVAFNSTTRSYGGYLDNDGDGVIAETAAEWQALRGVGPRPLPAHVSFGRGLAGSIPGDPSSDAIGFDDERIEFDSRGLTMPIGAGGVVYIASDTDPAAVVAVQLTPSGSVRLWTYRTDGGWR